VALSQDLTRSNVFLDVSLNLPILKIIGEVGQVSGGSVPLTNSFSSGGATDSRVFGSLGIRIAW
jgi:hypothetical protein